MRLARREGQLLHDYCCYGDAPFMRLVIATVAFASCYLCIPFLEGICMNLCYILMTHDWPLQEMQEFAGHIQY